jgi:hypothetical protein
MKMKTTLFLEEIDMSRKNWFFIVFTSLVLASLACTLGSSAGTKATQKPAPVKASKESDQPVAQEKNEASAENPAEATIPIPVSLPTYTPLPTYVPLPTLAPTSIPSNPIGLWAGLSSLNSYRLTIRVVNNGPTPQDRSETTYMIETGSDGDSTHIHNESLSSSAEYPELDTSSSDQYTIGSRTCDYSEGSDEVEKSDVDPMVQEMSDTWFKLIDLTPMITDPVFAGEEELNGVMTNHFTFTVSGLGVDSGAEVVASSGEYWLAQDGQYIVKYSILLETRNGPAGDANTRTLHSAFFIEVQNINQEIVITFPANCQ